MTTDLRISNISKLYPGCIANDNVSLQFKSGKIYALLGENGAGKSTLVKILSGVISPDGGEVFLNEIGSTVGRQYSFKGTHINGPHFPGGFSDALEGLR